MDDILLLEAVERYIRGEMNPDERVHFEQLRKANAEVDQMVVEHTLFLQQLNRMGEWKKLKSALQAVHTDLSEKGQINSDKLTGKAKVVYLWKRYKRVAAIAASIAGITTLSFSALVWSISPKAPTTTDYQQLYRDVTETKKELSETKKKTYKLENDLAVVKGSKTSNPEISYKTIGTAFFIDANGLMITNAHVVKNSKNISVFNAKGDKFNAIVLKLDIPRDVALIKITDDQFKPFAALPYGFTKGATDLAEPLFTLGFPRDEIVYGEGYFSAKTGFNGDTLSCQISVAANPGNSGGPVFNNNGEVIGILSGKETGAESTVFAVRSKYIYQAVEELKKNSLYKGVKIPSKSSVAKLDKVDQVKRIQDYVFMVKGD